MADIQLRFGHDILVLSSSAKSYLERLDAEIESNIGLTMLVEPEVFDDFYDLEHAVGAQCLITETSFLTPSRLAHLRLGDDAPEIAATALELVRKRKPQHILVEIGPCGLPLDASSKVSLVENRDQYARAAVLFDEMQDGFDAFFLNGFADVTDLKCALMGLRKVTDKPIFASVDLSDEDMDEGHLAGPKGERLRDAVAVMAEYGAQVAGIRSCAAPQKLCLFVREMRQVTDIMPVLVQIDVRYTLQEPDFSEELLEALGEDIQKVAAEEVRDHDKQAENPDDAMYAYLEPDSMMRAAEMLCETGVQFLRATGRATPVYTGALVGSTVGDIVRGASAKATDAGSRLTGSSLSIDDLKAKASRALKG